MLTMPHRPSTATSSIARVCAVAAALAALVALASPSARAATGPVAAYDFNESSGAVLHDASGNGNNGTILNGAWTSGKYGGALRFNGSSSRVSVPSSTSLSAWAGVTLEAWVRPASLGASWRDVAMKEQPGGLTYGLYATSSQSTPAGVVFTNGSERTDYGRAGLRVNSWSHVAATYDGTVLAVYVNGALSSTQIASGPILTSTGALQIGGDTVWGEWFNGRIDELRVYDRALSGAEIASDMTTPITTAKVTSSVDSTPPSAPGALTATTTTTSVTLGWSASTDNVGVSGYTVFNGSSTAGTTTATSYTVSGLACGTTYTFAVDAYDAAGNHSSKTSATAVTAACPDTQAPSAPSSVAVSSRTTTSVSFSWGASSDNVGVAGYTVYNGGNQTGTTNATTYTLSGLACGTTYSLAVDAYDAAGNHSTKSSLSAATAACPAADTSPPTAPVGLVGTAAQTSVALSWAASTDNVGVTGYTVYNGSGQVGSSTGTSYTVTGLGCASTYVLSVDAVDAAGNRSTKATVSATTTACPDTQAPSSPSGVTVVGTTTGSISIAWNAATDNVGVAGYTVYNGGNQTGTTNATSYTAAGLTCGTSYTLAVDAYDTAGNRSGKASVTGSTQPCPDTQPPSVPGSLVVSSHDATSATLTWSASTDSVGVTGYTVYNGGNQVTTTAATSYTLTGLACGSSYSVAIDAYDAAGNHSARSSVTVTTTGCSGPATLYLSPSGSDGNVCSQAAPCKSFDRGYHLAQPGQTVVVAAGSYGDQAISADASKAAAASDVLLQASGTVNVHLLDVNGARHLTLAGFTVTRYSASQAAAFVTFKNVSTGSFYITNATDLSIIGGQVGPWDSNVLGLGEDPEIGTQQSPQPNNILIKGVTFHDILNTSDPTAHADCLQFTSGQNVTIVGNIFRHCGNDADVYIRGDFGPVANYTIENNFFGASQGFFSLRLSGQSAPAPVCTNFLIANNSGSRGPVNASGGTGDEMWGNCTAQGSQGVRWIGNITGSMSNSDCTASTSVGETWDHNITIAGAPCGTNAAQGNVTYANPSESVVDLHLTGTSNPAYGFVPQATTHAPDDYDGNRRPTTGPVDAGADEVTAVASVPASDTTPPSTPGGLAASSATQTTVTLGWNASTDNVGVTGYTVYNGSTTVTTTASTSATVSALSCGSSYTFSVDAYDAAGNHSQKATTTAKTAACPPQSAGSASFYVSPTGSDSNACTQAAPCKSFDRAYHVASLGQTVEVAAGSYPQQSITTDSSKTGTGHVTFQPALGASVTVGSTTTTSSAPTGLDIGAAHVTISGMRVPFYDITGSDVTMQNVNGDTWYVTGSQVSILGGVYGPYAPPCSGTSPLHDNPTITPGSSTPTGDVVRGAVFHDMNANNCAGSHMDCLQVAGAVNLDIDANKFVNCYSNDLILTGDFGVMNNITVENNWFGPTLAGNRELNWNATKNCPNGTVRYNTLGGVGMQFVCNTDGTARAYGNIVPRVDSFECGSGAIKATQDYEVASQGTVVAACGAHSYVAPDGQVDLASRQAAGASWQNLDYHLTASSEAIGRGSPTDHPTDDIDGQTRPANGPTDAGADQH